MRYAVVRGHRSRREVEAYLPDNYEVVSEHLAEPRPNGRTNIVIGGEDVAGWTLDGYIIPRLGSGLISAKEYPTHADAVDAAAASMN